MEKRLLIVIISHLNVIQLNEMQFKTAADIGAITKCTLAHTHVHATHL